MKSLELFPLALNASAFGEHNCITTPDGCVALSYPRLANTVSGNECLMGESRRLASAAYDDASQSKRGIRITLHVSDGT